MASCARKRHGVSDAVAAPPAPVVLTCVTLLPTGELHNNVRMTWGKAFLQWAPDPAAALRWGTPRSRAAEVAAAIRVHPHSALSLPFFCRAALHVNHRWALDGCDPASYAGVLWCFGERAPGSSAPF